MTAFAEQGMWCDGGIGPRVRIYGYRRETASSPHIVRVLKRHVNFSDRTLAVEMYECFSETIALLMPNRHICKRSLNVDRLPNKWIRPDHGPGASTALLRTGSGPRF